MKPLSATLRLQFHSDFTLDHAVSLVPYFAQLGISHLYASPILKARAGSRHGYDVVDPTQVNPELGGEAALQRLVAALRQHGMGLILDTVSNHMAVGGVARTQNSSTSSGIPAIRCWPGNCCCRSWAMTMACA